MSQFDSQPEPESTAAAQLQAPLNFDEIANLLAPLGTLNSPSELHGLLCGKLAGGASLAPVQWLLEAVEFLDFVSAPDERVRALLTQLYQVTLDEFAGQAGITLMLPDDDTSSLNERARCLSEWCHGFLTGFGSVELLKPRTIDADDAEMLQDLANIVQLQIDEDELAAAAEADFVEVVEYVRMVAISLHFEFSAAVIAASADDATLH